MKLFVAVFLILLAAAIPLPAQESESATEEMPMAPPQPLNDDWSQWLVGEWVGTSESSMGTTEDWMKIEPALDGQFLVMSYKSKTTKVNPEMIKGMAEQMKMSEAEVRKMMYKPFEGLGITTFDPKTDDLKGYWFDNYREISTGRGKQEGNSSTMTWKSSVMEIERKVTRVDKNTLTVTFTGKDAGGAPFSGSSTMTRKQ